MRRPFVALACLAFAAASAQAQSAPPRIVGVEADADAPCDTYVSAFERGLAAFQAGATDVARAAWGEVETVEGCGPDVAYNLATLDALDGRLDAAAPAFARALDRLDAWPDSVQRLDGVRELRRLALAGLLAVGVRHYDAGRYEAALAAFDTLARRDALHRDGAYNRALTLVRLDRPGRAGARERRAALAAALAFDPLSAALHSLDARADLAAGDAREARRAHARADALPIDVRAVSLDPETGRGAIDLEGHAATAGTPLRLDLTLLRPDGPAATTVVTVRAPTRGERVQVPIALPVTPGATGIRYRRLP